MTTQPPKQTRTTSPKDAPRARAARAAVCALAAGLMAAVGGTGGCYERVTAVRGFGGGAYSVAQPYQETSSLDEWFWGEDPKDRRPIRRYRGR